MNHTPEPYRQECDGEQVYITGSAGLERVCTMAAAGRGLRLRDSARIVACVNACAGMADPAGTLANYRALLKQALPLIDAFRKLSGGDGDITAALIRAALDL